MLTRDKNARTPYDSLYIFQTTCTIILKFSGSNLFYVSVKKIKNLKILLFLNSTGYAHVPNMSMNKFSTFLYIKIFIVSIGLFVSYLILEFLIMFTYDLSQFDCILFHSWVVYNTLSCRHTPKIANPKYVLFSIFSKVFLSILVEEYACLYLHIIYCIFITTFHRFRSHITTWAAQTRPKLQVQKPSFFVIFPYGLLMICCNFITPFLIRGWHKTLWVAITPQKLINKIYHFF